VAGHPRENPVGGKLVTTAVIAIAIAIAAVGMAVGRFVSQTANKR
jgi:hypothetical protein